MNKQTLSERDICTKFITPALEKAGWDVLTQVREEVVLTKGRIIVRGKLHTRGQHKRADYVLFHKPIYTYSLRQGIDDGFLAPYKVVRIDLDKDLTGWRPDKGMLDKHGNEIEDRIYNQRDFDKTLVLEQRTHVVARKISEYLKASNRFDKTIVFCDNIDHAERMRQALVNENADFDKYWFTILDFKKATELFADPTFDGDPVQIYEPGPGEPPLPPDEEDGEASPDDEFTYPTPDDNPTSPGGVAEPLPGEEGSNVRRYVVSNVEVKVVAERVQYFDANGKLITESLKDYTRNTLAKEFASLDDFLCHWSKAEKKQAIIDELAHQGIFFEALADEVDKQSGKDFDPFDLLCHVAWDQPPLTRKERAEQVKKRHYFAKYGEEAQKVLEALLDKYADEGVAAIEETQILSIAPFNRMGTPIELVRAFGGKTQYQQAVGELERELYRA